MKQQRSHFSFRNVFRLTLYSPLSYAKKFRPRGKEKEAEAQELSALPSTKRTRKRWSRFTYVAQSFAARQATTRRVTGGGSQLEVPKMADLIDHNIETIISLHMHTELQVNRHQRILEYLTARVGRPRSFYLVLLLVALWVVFNVTTSLFHLNPPDPAPFYWLQGVVGLGALLLTILILTTQNRQAHIAERGKHLDLQINLIVEHKVSKLIALVEELRRDMPQVKNRYDQEAEEMSEAVDPRMMFVSLDETLEEVSREVEQTLMQSDSDTLLDLETSLEIDFINREEDASD